MKLIPISTDLNQTPSRWSLKFSPKINVFIKKWGHHRPLFIYFQSFQTAAKILQQINVEN